MYENESKINLRLHLKVLLKLHQYLGLIDFTYNRRTRRFETSTPMQHFSAFILKFYKAVSLGTIVFLLVILQFYYENLSLIVPMEDILQVGRVFWMFFNVYLLTLKFTKHRRTLMGTLNQLLSTFERIKKLTDKRIYFPSSFQKLLTLRLLLLLHEIMKQNWAGLGLLARAVLLAIVLLSIVLVDLAYWANLYGNLVLACFYLKMTEHLQELSSATDECARKRRIREMISISSKIHRLKVKLNEIFKLIHIMWFFGLFNDIFFVYKLLQYVMVVKLYGKSTPTLKFISRIGRNLISGMWASYSLFLNGHMGEAVNRTEEAFRRKLLSMFYENDEMLLDKEYQCEIDVFFLRQHVQDLFTKFFNLFVIDHRFSFDFIRNVTFAYAIVCFQSFMAACFQTKKEREELLQHAGFDSNMNYE